MALRREDADVPNGAGREDAVQPKVVLAEVVVLLQDLNKLLLGLRAPITESMRSSVCSMRPIFSTSDMVENRSSIVSSAAPSRIFRLRRICHVECTYVRTKVTSEKKVGERTVSAACCSSRSFCSSALAAELAALDSEKSESLS